jgi:hypothetical protein
MDTRRRAPSGRSFAVPVVTSLLAVLAIVGPVRAQDMQPTAITPGTVVLPEPMRCTQEKVTDLVFSGRVGYGLALGDLVTDQALSDTVAGFVPLMFDLAWRFRFGLELGIGAMLGVGLHGDALDECSDCSIFIFAFGAQVNYHLLPGKLVDPWVGVIAGIDAMYISSDSTTASGLELKSTTTYRAFPTIALQGGVDFGGDGFSAGPFVSMSFATYTDASQEVSCTGPGCSSEPLSTQESSIPDAQRSSHSWLIMGAKASFW